MEVFWKSFVGLFYFGSSFWTKERANKVASFGLNVSRCRGFGWLMFVTTMSTGVRVFEINSQEVSWMIIMALSSAIGLLAVSMIFYAMVNQKWGFHAQMEKPGVRDWAKKRVPYIYSFSKALGRVLSILWLLIAVLAALTGEVWVLMLFSKNLGVS